MFRLATATARTGALAARFFWTRHTRHTSRAGGTLIAAAAAAAAAAVVVPTVAFSEASATPSVQTTEPATGLAFDNRFSISPHSGCPVVFDFELVGTGCR